MYPASFTFVDESFTDRLEPLEDLDDDEDVDDNDIDWEDNQDE